MIRLSTLLLAPPVGERLRARYDDYRQHGASWLSASLGCLWASLVWALMPLETPRWQAILARHETYFPHINPHRPRPLDPLRYLLQSLWLLTTRVPEPEKKVNWRSLAALEGVHGRYTQWLEKLPEQMNARTGHLDKQKELAHLNPKLRRAILGGVTFCSLVLALMCITQPFNPLSQFIFLMLLWGVALLVRRIPGRFSALMLIVLSLTVSCRYIWWRYTSTLNWNDPVSLVCGIILLFAETYAWVVLVLGYFQVVWPLNRQPVPLPEDMDLWPTVDIFVPVLPHMIHASLTNSKIQGKYRHSFWSEIYETVLAWYIAPPTFVALINPHKGKFNVTAKGGLVEEEYVDWVISRPYIYLVLLNLVGVAVGIWRFMYGPENEILTVWVSIVWVFYNLIILGGAVAVSVESKQVRRSHRVEMSMPAAIAREDGHLFSCTVHDYSDGGLGIKINGDAQVLEGQNARLLLKRGQQEYAFPVRVARVNGSEVGLQLLPLTNQQHIDFVQCTFARADTWALWQDSFPEDKPMESLLDILKLGFRGYRHLAEFSPPSVKVVFRALTSLVAWIASFVPRRPERAAPTLSADPAMAQQ
ncbi:TPA: PilZ domain-containing protein [Klebsiella pneumoniae]|nr:PilZ domain-containing protein [Klebsiella pneumoniae]HBQ5398150.1 PilZ domain-containing protein [Klebsiella pneumoniae]HEK7891097.1 PilZ domain-containing protein [Klebsiella pneumoniae]HEK7981861.1 PilZ domain-containing protein [Klebsiella pneumoniae]